MAQVYISIGSNINREEMIRSCIKSLNEVFGDVTRSSVYESISVGFEGDNFLNMVVGFSADDHVDLIKKLRDIEQAHGRTREEKKYASRSLDLDLLLFDNEDLHDKGIDVPRAEILNYAFVLGPLAELIPDSVHPITGKTFADMWSEFCVERPTEADSIWPVTFDW
ncbi:2-amino-4-hydroxy-6-hydroxymethyldihydropteridine diphosphokinase [Kaarinaea lacus]